MTRCTVVRTAALVLIFLLVVAPLGSAGNDDLVAFNKSTLKYHCVTCQWAKKCTRNCITITRREAIDRGGVACKVCRGKCA